MRLNPIILQAAAPALLVLCLVSSCCRSKASIDEEDAILIGVAQAGTKAIIDNEGGSDRIKNMIGQCYDGTTEGSNRKNNAGFGVYGYKQPRNDASNSVRLFNNMRVYPALETRPASISETSDWTYDYPRFWDPNGSYQFIAYWPWMDSSGSGSYATDIESNKTLYLKNVPNWQPVNGNEKDFMTATKTGSYDPDFMQTNKKVYLSFYHILSQLEIRAYYVGSDMEVASGQFGGGVKVKKILLSESSTGAKDVLYGSDATKPGESTDYKQRYDDAKALQASGENDNKIDLAASYMLMDNSTGVLIPFKDELTEKYYMWNSSLTPSAGKAIVDGPVTIGRWLMVPHKWQDINISVNYSYKANEQDGGINPNLYADNVPKTPTTIGEENHAYVVQPGKKYIITLVFDTTSGGITVKQISVQDWVEHDVSFEYYNW